MIKTLLITEVKLYRYKEKYYSSESFSNILARYRKKFSNLKIITRIINSSKVPTGYTDITILCKEFINIKSIPKVFLKEQRKIIKREVLNSDFVILRMPSIIGTISHIYIKKFDKTYLTENMGCAWDAYWNHGIIGKIIAPIGYFKMKKIVFNADYSTYVTNKFLQKRYPCKNDSIGVSNVHIDEIHKHNNYDIFNPNSFSVLTAGNVDVIYKGQEYVIKSMKSLKNKGIVINYFLAGGGNNYRLKKIAKKQGVEGNVFFLGRLSHEQLIEKMREIDFYVQPSLQEGLPRSVIEAQSCGCICLGSNTAGIPELIDDCFIFRRKSYKDIEKKFLELLDKKQYFNKISEENNKRAKDYYIEKLNKKRFDYYEKIIKELSNKGENL